jgi:hypothetical protein
MNQLDDFLEKHLLGIISEAVQKYKADKKEVIEKLKEKLNLQAELLIVAKDVNNNTIIHSVQRLHIGDSKEIQIIRDETKYASPEELQSIREKVKELAELLKKAADNGITSFHILKVPFTFSPQNPYPAIYDELKSKYKYPKLDLLPKEKVPKVLKTLNMIEKILNSNLWKEEKNKEFVEKFRANPINSQS